MPDTSLPTIAPTDLARQIGRPDAPAVLDVRTDDDFEAGPHLIPTAARASHRDLPIRRSRVVVGCQKGLKLSGGAVARRGAQGVMASRLRGETDGSRNATRATLDLAYAALREGAW